MTNLFDLFAESAARRPESVALEVESRATTYAQLYDMVLRTAAQLQPAVAGSTGRVGLQAAPVPATYIVYLALLRLGVAVVPVAADSSPSRIDALAREASLDIVLTRAAVSGAVQDAQQVRRLDGAGTAAQGSVAYVLFTSGSTGVPKGIPITHGNVLSYLDHAIPASELSPDSRVSHTFSLTFDPSVFDMFATWGAGAALVIPAGRDLLVPSRYVTGARISHWFSVPSVVSLAGRANSIPPGSMPGLRWSGFIGEPLTLSQARTWQLAAPGSVVDNVYGPTELTVACTGYRLPRSMDDWPRTANETVPIGRPYPGLEHIVVGADGAPAGRGELCMRGPQRFSGYVREADNVNRFYRSVAGRVETPALTAPVDPDLWYRTGDLVETRDGELVHVGRLDRQLKVRGYRIEPEEIESVLRQHADIEDAVITTSSTAGSASLLAFVVGDRRRDRQVREYLLDRLPRHLVPSRLVWVDNLPVNARGKVDHKELAAMAAGYR